MSESERSTAGIAPTIWRAHWFIPTTLFFGSLLIIVVTAGDYGVVWDEPAYFHASDLHIRWIGQFVQVHDVVRAFMGDPSALAKAVGVKATRKIMEHLNNPNRAIRRMFEIRERSMNRPPPGPIQQFGAQVARSVPGIAGVGVASTTSRDEPIVSVTGP